LSEKYFGQKKVLGTKFCGAYPKEDLLTNSFFRENVVCLLAESFKRLTKQNIYTAFISLFRFNAIADKRHSSIAF